MQEVNLEGMEPLEVLEALFEGIQTLLANDPESLGFGSLCAAQKTAYELAYMINEARYEAGKREGVIA